MKEEFALNNLKDKHAVTDKMLNNLKQVAYSQDDFGVNKYNKSLNANMDYDWLKMLREELADGLKYLECEAERKEVVINLIKHAVALKDWNYIYMALNELLKDGTGK